MKAGESENQMLERKMLEKMKELDEKKKALEEIKKAEEERARKAKAEAVVEEPIVVAAPEKPKPGIFDYSWYSFYKLFLHQQVACLVLQLARRLSPGKSPT